MLKGNKKMKKAGAMGAPPQAYEGRLADPSMSGSEVRT